MKPNPVLVCLLRALLPTLTRDSVTGDLLEEFEERQSQWWLARQVASFVGASAWFGCSVRTGGAWLAAFLVVVLLALKPFFPAFPAVVYLLSLPGVSFFIAHRTGSFRAAWITGIVTCACMLVAGIGFILAFHLPHPPRWSLLIPAAVTVGSVTVFAIAGKCASDRIDDYRLVR